jgi:hypothetical protein
VPITLGMWPKNRLSLAVGLAVWAAGIAAGFAGLQAYSARAGTSRAPSDQAAGFLVSHQRIGRPLLVMAVHPRCPCTDASLAELGDLLARSRGACDALLLQYHPAGWPAEAAFQTLGGVRVPVVPDLDGRVATTLGAETSGHCVLVDARGAIRFYGGLTLARGHRGRSPAQDAILQVVGGGTSSLTSAPVYGCELGPVCRPNSTP